MEIKKSAAKAYFSNNKYFADACNYVLNDGEEIIKPEELKDIDTADWEFCCEEPVREMLKNTIDVMKLYETEGKGKAVFILSYQGIVGDETSILVFLACVVGYINQLIEIARSGKCNEPLEVRDGFMEISEAFEICGLLPVIVIVIYTGDEYWDVVEDLQELFAMNDEGEVPSFPKSRMSFIFPSDMNPEDFAKFHTDLGKVLEAVKRKPSDLPEALDEASAAFLSALA